MILPLFTPGKLRPHRVEAGIDPVLDRPLATRSCHAMTVKLVPIAQERRRLAAWSPSVRLSHSTPKKRPRRPLSEMATPHARTKGQEVAINLPAEFEAGATRADIAAAAEVGESGGIGLIPGLRRGLCLSLNFCFRLCGSSTQSSR